MSQHTIIYGTAVPAGPSTGIGENVRYLTDPYGLRYIGAHTHAIEHACSQSCLAELRGTDCDPLAAAVDPDPASEDPYGNAEYQTVDVEDFNPGDDTYVVCAACGEVMRCDDEMHWITYGAAAPGHGTDRPHLWGEPETGWATGAVTVPCRACEARTMPIDGDDWELIATERDAAQLAII